MKKFSLALKALLACGYHGALWGGAAGALLGGLILFLVFPFGAMVGFVFGFTIGAVGGMIGGLLTTSVGWGIGWFLSVATLYGEELYLKAPEFNRPGFFLLAFVVSAVGAMAAIPLYHRPHKALRIQRLMSIVHDSGIPNWPLWMRIGMATGTTIFFFFFKVWLWHSLVYGWNWSLHAIAWS